MKILLYLITSLLLSYGPCEDSNNNSDERVSGEDYILILNKSGNTAWQLGAEAGDRIAEYQTGTAPHEVAVSPDQSRAIITNYGANTPGNTLTILNLNTQEVSKTISLGKYRRPHGVEWFSDGKRAIVTAEDQQAVIIVNIDTGEILSAIKTDQEVSHMAVLGADEETTYATNLGSGSLSILDLRSGTAVETIQTGAGTEGITTVARKNEVWITNRSANTVSILDAGNNTIVETMESSSFPIRVEVSPDAQLAAVSNARSSEVSIFDIDTRKQIQKISTVGNGESGMPIGLTFSNDNSRLYVANSNSNDIAVIDTQNWQVVSRFTTGETPDGIAYISSENN